MAEKFTKQFDASNLRQLVATDRSVQQVVNFKVDKVVKDGADAVLASLGMSMSSYLGLCMRQISFEGGLPFIPSSDAAHWYAQAEVSDAVEVAQSDIPLMFCMMYEEYKRYSALATALVRTCIDVLDRAHEEAIWALGYMEDTKGEDELEQAGPVGDIASKIIADFEYSLERVDITDLMGIIDWENPKDATRFIEVATGAEMGAMAKHIALMRERAKRYHDALSSCIGDIDACFDEPDEEMATIADSLIGLQLEIDRRFPQDGSEDVFTFSYDLVYQNLYLHAIHFSEMVDDKDMPLADKVRTAIRRLRDACVATDEHLDLLQARFLVAGCDKDDLEELRQAAYLMREAKSASQAASEKRERNAVDSLS